jgi:branched-chain amino acid transport system substrate-binding protein
MAIYRFDRQAKRVARRDVLKGGAAVAALAAAGPHYLRHARAQEGPIKIGFPVPLSGPYSTEASDQVRCAQLAIDLFNESGGLKGRKAELVVRDDKLDPGEAATRALELIESDKVNFLCGSLSASVQLSVNQVASKRGVIYNSISQSDTINEASDFTKYTFHEALNPHLTSGAVGRFAFSKLGKKVAYLIADYAYGHEMARGFRRIGKEFGVEEVAEVKHPLGTTDYSTFFPRIQAARPEILVCINFGRDQLNTIKQASDFGLKRQMKIVYPVLLATQRLAGGAAPFEGVIGGANYYWGLGAQIASAKRLNDGYREKYGDAVPSDYGALGYAGVYGLLEGVRKAGSTDTDAVIAAMEQMKYDAYKGQQYFRKCDHQAVQSVLILQSKPASQVKGKWDIFDVVERQGADETKLRTCDELGHKA